MVVAGTTEDKKEVTAHVGWSGVGINLRTSRPSPDAIAEAVQSVLNEPRFRERTGVLQAETSGTNPAAVAAELLEDLAVRSSEGSPRHTMSDPCRIPSRPSAKGTQPR